MEADQVEIVKAIEADPKLFLLAKAISELSEKYMVHEVTLQTIQMVLVDQQNRMKLINDSLQKMGEAVDVIIKQMFIISHHPAIPTAFKGVFIK